MLYLFLAEFPETSVPLNTPVMTSRKLQHVHPTTEPKQAWLETLSTAEDHKLGLIDLHPDVFATYPRYLRVICIEFSSSISSCKYKVLFFIFIFFLQKFIVTLFVFRLDLLYDNVKWQMEYKHIVSSEASSRVNHCIHFITYQYPNVCHIIIMWISCNIWEWIDMQIDSVP
jgi:hypothetical protein